MKRRAFLGSLGAGLLAARAQDPARRPNIVFILADDLGYGDVGCYGQTRIATPNIDRLAAEGVRFTDAYAGDTVCAPSRCALITGMHTGHARIRGNGGKVTLLPGDLAVSEVLKRAGYRTGIFGKWSLGGINTTGYPLAKGFDEWFGFFNQTQAHNYYPELLLDGQHEVWVAGNTGTRKQTYVPDLITERSLEFLDKAAPGPFFLHVCYTIPHANNEMGRDTGNGMEVPSDAPYTSKDWPQVEKNFAAMVTRMDSDIGKLMARLKAKGQDGNTIVFFSSDNGPHKEGGHNPEFFASRGPLRGIKRDVYEGGIRVPAIVRWPGKVAAGRVSAQPWAFWDFLPTAAELAGAAVPIGIDGISMLPAILGQPQKSHDYLYWEFHERGAFKQAVRMGDWKGVRVAPEARTELYNLKTDLGETRNVAADHPDVVRRIEGIFQSARTDSKDFPVPVSRASGGGSYQ